MLYCVCISVSTTFSLSFYPLMDPGCFHVLAVVNSAAMNIPVHDVSFIIIIIIIIIIILSFMFIYFEGDSRWGRGRKRETESQAGSVLQCRTLSGV